MSEKIKKLHVSCEPEFSTVCRLLGDRRTDQGELKRIFDTELVHLRELVQSTALMREVSFHTAGEAGKDLETADSLVVLLTVGEAGEQYVHELFAQGEHLRALVVDAMLSAWLFAMDEKVQNEIRDCCI